MPTAVAPGDVLKQVEQDRSRLAELDAQIAELEGQHSLALVEGILAGGRAPTRLKAEIVKVKDQRGELAERVAALDRRRRELARRQAALDFKKLLPQASAVIKRSEQARQARVTAAVTLAEAGEECEAAELAAASLSRELEHLHRAGGLTDPLPAFPSAGVHVLTLPGGRPLIDLLRCFAGHDRLRPFQGVAAFLAPIRAAQGRKG